MILLLQRFDPGSNVPAWPYIASLPEPFIPRQHMKKRRSLKRPAQAPGASPQPDRGAHLRQAKQNMAESAVQLKKQIAAIQQQSLQTLRDSVQSVFKNNNATGLQQMVRQQQEVLTEPRKPVRPAAPPAAQVPLVNPTVTDGSQAGQIDGGQQAVAIANKGALQALESARKGFAAVKQLMSNLDKQRRKK
jgi:hypothetical protein